MTVNNIINNGFYAKSETFGGNGADPCITGMDNKLLSLYAKGMATREIAAAFKELYDADVSPALISKVTDAVMEPVVEWQNRPLDAVYPIVYLVTVSS